MDFDAAAILDEAGATPDEALKPAIVALALAAVHHPGISIGRYVSHLDKLSGDVAARFNALCTEGAEDNAGTRLAALQYVLADTEQYEGDTDNYDALENADLMRVIDRRRGLPVALSILYMHAASAQGWPVRALNFPGHVVCRIDTDGQRFLFDPFERCKVMEAHHLRAIVKRVNGPGAELSVDYYEAVSNRAVLTRLQNNIKLRQVEAGDYEAALATVERMRLIDPDEYRLLFDEGVLGSKVGRKKQAMKALEEYIHKAPDYKNRQEAATLLQHIRLTME